MIISDKMNITLVTIIIIAALILFIACGNKNNHSINDKNRDGDFSDSLVIELAGFTGKSLVPGA